jgi:hypothetical protein
MGDDFTAKDFRTWGELRLASSRKSEGRITAFLSRYRP